MVQLGGKFFPKYIGNKFINFHSPTVTSSHDVTVTLLLADNRYENPPRRKRILPDIAQRETSECKWIKPDVMRNRVHAHRIKINATSSSLIAFRAYDSMYRRVHLTIAK